jgi:hypothetical protein
LVKEIGLTLGLRWYRQHETLDKLNIQAHKNALQGADDFVMNSFVLEDKVSQRVKIQILR